MNGRRLRLVAILAVVAVVVGNVAVHLWHGGRDDVPEAGDLPQAEDVESMRLSVFAQDHRRLSCEVPADHFAPVLAALQPSRRDPHRALWVVLGEIDLTLHGGRHFEIDLYDPTGLGVGTASGPALYSAGPTGQRHAYYQGGTDQGIKAAIRAACP